MVKNISGSMTLSAGVESKKKPGVSSCLGSATCPAVILVTETVESWLKIVNRCVPSSIDLPERIYVRQLTSVGHYR